MKTRKQYLNGEVSHREYHAQFVNDTIKQNVLNHVGLNRLMKSTDKHLNDIPLDIWDSIPMYDVSKKLKEVGDYLTLAGAVCIAKEAARQIIESNKRAF
jgi:hypothetical protein